MLSTVLVRGTVERPTLIYDGSCDFCRRWIRRVQGWDRGSNVRYLALQDHRATALSGRSREDLEKAAHLVRPDGAVFAGAAAARELCAYLPGGWLLRSLLSIPGAMPVAEQVYGWVARRWGPVP